MVKIRSNALVKKFRMNDQMKGRIDNEFKMFKFVHLAK